MTEASLHSIRSEIVKFRLSSHQLAIEIGGHVKPKIELQDRLCVYCDSKVIEGECHVLIECKFYKDERCKFLRKCNVNLENYNAPIDGFVCIMTIIEVAILVQLGIFVRKCLKKRS